jgi:hypothetical protein
MEREMDFDLIDCLNEKFGDPREASKEGLRVSFEPHRTNDSKDEDQNWCWKMRIYENDKTVAISLL